MGGPRRRIHVVDHLAELVAGARARVVAGRADEPLERLRRRASRLPSPPSFEASLRGPGVAVIAEIKRASPSRGLLAPELDARVQAVRYRDGGAAAISVLTEPGSFRGSLDDLAAVAGLGLPALRKDFVIDPYQVWEARAAGAAAVLLIVAALEPDQLVALLDSCREAGLDALVEVHDPDEARRAADAGASTVGVNARDLHTFEVDREAFARIRQHLPDGVCTVDESGIASPSDVEAAARAGADAVLVGESLVTAADARAAVAALVAAGAPLGSERS